MPVYREGTVGFQGYYGSYLVGARFEIAVGYVDPQYPDPDASRREYRLLEAFDFSQGASTPSVPVRSYYGDDPIVPAREHGDGNNTSLATDSSGLRQQATFVLSWAPAFADVEYAEPPFLTDGWAVPQFVTAEATSETRLRVLASSGLPTLEEMPALYDPASYAFTSGLVCEAVMRLHDTAIELQTAPQAPDAVYELSAPQMLLLDKGLVFTTPTTIEFLGFVEEPVVDEPVTISLTLTDDTPEVRATVMAFLGYLLENAPPGQGGFHAEGLEGYLADYYGITATVLSLAPTDPSSPNHRLTLGTVTFVTTAPAIMPDRPVHDDVRLFHTADGGDVDIDIDDIATFDSMETAVYLSLFGGNERDSGLEGDAPLQWWGNLGEPERTRQYRSETQHLLRSLVATPANLRRIEDAVERDLAWLLEKEASRISVLATIPALNTVRITVKIETTRKLDMAPVVETYIFQEQGAVPS
jgi:phage gp46-like protein